MKAITRRNFLMGSIGLGLTTNLLGAKLGSESCNTLEPSTKSPSVNLSRLLACIAEVETGNDDTKIGPCGSRSRYQIHERTWYQYTNQNFVLKCWGRTALRIAKLHILWLYDNLEYPTPYRLALAWHRGLTYAQVTQNKLHPLGQAYRVHNLYHDSDFLTAAFLNNNNDEFATAYRSNRPQPLPPHYTG